MRIPSGETEYAEQAYGWQVSRTGRGTTLIYQDGDYWGYQSAYYRYRDEDLVIVLALNVSLERGPRGWRSALYKAIEGTVFGEDYTWVVLMAFLMISGLVLKRSLRRRA